MVGLVGVAFPHIQIALAREHFVYDAVFKAQIVVEGQTLQRAL